MATRVHFSGGESSAIVAIEVVRKFGKENVVLLNHDISPKVEDADAKRFKKEISNYLGLPMFLHQDKLELACFFQNQHGLRKLLAIPNNLKSLS